MELFDQDPLERIESKLDEILQLLKGSGPSKVAKISDEIWLEGLSQDPTYAGIDVKNEVGKCIHWCQQNNKQPSRKRIINWLNRAERPVRVVAPAPKLGPPVMHKKPEVPVEGVPPPPEVVEQLSKLFNKKWGFGRNV